MTEHPTLLGAFSLELDGFGKGLHESSPCFWALEVLSRELRENAKRSYELAVAITGLELSRITSFSSLVCVSLLPNTLFTESMCPKGMCA